jgi:hypothetical protein
MILSNKVSEVLWRDFRQQVDCFPNHSVDRLATAGWLPGTLRDTQHVFRSLLL